MTARPYARLGKMRLGSSRLGSYQPIKKFTIAGVDRTANCRTGGWSITDTLNGTPNTMTGRVSGFVPMKGQEIIVGLGNTTDLAQRIFAGHILSVTTVYRLNFGQPVAYDIQCISYEWLLNRRIFSGRFLTTSATDVVLAIMASTSGFTTAGVEANLPSIDEITFTNEEVTQALDRVAQRIGGGWVVDYGKDLQFFLESYSAVHTIDDDSRHGVDAEGGFQVSADFSQVRTRVLHEGGGVNALADVAVGETLFPVEDVGWYADAGGMVACGQQRATYTGKIDGGGGGLVGPGAAPSSAPVLAQAGGAGVETGAHTYAVTFVTGAGESIASPIAAVTVGLVGPPATGPQANSASAGSGPDTGPHQYAVTFVTAAGETLQNLSATGTYITTSSVTSGLIAAPTSAPNAGAPTAGGSVTPGTQSYSATFINASGETTPGPVGASATASAGLAAVTSPTAPSIVSSHANGPTSAVAVGDVVYIAVTYLTATGETLATVSNSVTGVSYGGAFPTLTDIILTGTIPTSGNPAVTSKRVYYNNNGAWLGYENLAAAAGSTSSGVFGSGYIAGAPPVSNTTAIAATQTLPVSNIPIGPSGTTGRKLYRSGTNGGTKLVASISGNVTTTYSDTTADGSLGASAPTTNTTSATTAYNRVNLTSIPIGPALVTSRNLWRTAAGGSQLKFVATIANNTTTVYQDTLVDSGLGVNIPTTNTAVANRVALSGIAIGASAVTSRKIYRTAAAGSQLKLQSTIADNTTTTLTDSTADASLGANVPVVDTSGLAQPNGQVAAGSTSLMTASMGSFPSQGWAIAGAQTIRYTSVTSTSLAGIPSSGPGSIQASIGYNATVTSAPQLVGVPSSGVGSILYAVLKGDPVNLLVIENDLAAQAAMAAAVGGDGVHELYLQDRRLSETEARVRARATLLELKDPVIAVRYPTRDQTTRSGKDVTIAFASLQTFAERVHVAAPLAYWRLGESSAFDAAVDATGNERPLAITGGVTLGVAGAVADGDTAYRFNGTTGYVHSAGGYTPTGDPGWESATFTQFSYGWWMFAGAHTGTYRSLFYQGTEIIVALSDAFDSLFVQVAHMPGGVGPSSPQAMAPSVTPGAYAFYVVTFDGRYVKAYENAVVIGTKDCGSVGTIQTNASPLYIGRTYAGIEFFDGDLDDVAVYDRALTVDEIALQYAARAVVAGVDLNGTFKIQNATMTLPASENVFPLRSVEASSRRVSFEALLRLLKRAA